MDLRPWILSMALGIDERVWDLELSSPRIRTRLCRSQLHRFWLVTFRS